MKITVIDFVGASGNQTGICFEPETQADELTIKFLQSELFEANSECHSWKNQDDGWGITVQVKKDQQCK